MKLDRFDGRLFALLVFLFLANVACRAAVPQGYVYGHGISPAAATPTFSPVAGTYASAQSVTISTTSPGAIICYNTTGAPATNGTTGCTTGTLYSGPVTVSVSETLYAVAGGTGYADSGVGSAAYVISGGGGPTFVQGGANYTAAVTLGSNVTAGDGLFIACYGTADCTTPTVTGETVTTYTGTSGCQNFVGDDVQCYAVTNAVGGENTVTCNPVASSLCIVGEFTRPSHLATPKDAGGNSFESGSTGFTFNTSAATTNANDIVFACFGGFGANFTSGITITGFTMPAAMKYTYGACGYEVLSSTGTPSAAGSWSTSQRTTGIMIAFKP